MTISLPLRAVCALACALALGSVQAQSGNEVTQAAAKEAGAVTTASGSNAEARRVEVHLE